MSPWFGGFWERLIGMTKFALKKVLGRAFTTLDGLQTIIVEIEAMLNDRSLTYFSLDIRDPQPLTPAHLLYCRRIVSLPYPVMQGDELEDPDFEISSGIQARATVQATLLQHFWNRWKKEYLTGLREFHRTTGKNQQTVKPGAVVLVHDDIPRVKWRLAVVEDVIAGEDGLIRAANIRTSTGKSNRPVTKLYPLEVTASEPTPLPKISSLHPKENCTPTSMQSESVPAEGRPVRRAAL